MRLTFAPLVISVLVVGLAVNAQAERAVAITAVTGGSDTNAPLVIDPASEPTDAVTIDKNFGSGNNTLAFIRDMPVTKRIERVTLGDLASASSCATPASLRLYVSEHPTGDYSTATQIAVSGSYQDLPTDPGKVTWSIPPTTLREGFGYSFRVGRHLAKCQYGRITTWSHNANQVDGGAAGCEAGPPAQATGNPVHKRMWHVHGQEDRDNACATYAAPWAWGADMPTGWLHTNGSYVLTGWWTPGSSAPHPTDRSVCGQTAADAGARIVLWKVDPSGDEWFVCTWPSFAARNQSVTHGWYYGIPWWTGAPGGAPRDVYVKLDTIDYDVLLQRHSPILKYDSGEAFHVLSPGAISDFYLEGGIHEWSNALEDAEGEFAISNPSFADSTAWDLDLLTLNYLGETYQSNESPPSRRTGTQATQDDFVSARGNADDGNYDDDARYMELQPGYADKVYARAVYGDDGKLWLQYWFFYYFNPDPSESIGPVHEGDWEMIQVGLNNDLAPDVAVYSQHNTRQGCDWADVEKAGTLPVVYVGQYSHASFFWPSPLPYPFEIFDRADGQGGGLFSPVLERIGQEAPAWVSWPGQWGDSGGSPRGPRFQGEKWSDPSAWASDAPICFR